MDRTYLKRNVFRQLESPRQPLVDDLPEFFSLPPIAKRFALQPEDLINLRKIVEYPALEVMKIELAEQKATQVAMKAELVNLTASNADLHTHVTTIVYRQVKMEG